MTCVKRSYLIAVFHPRSVRPHSVIGDLWPAISHQLAKCKHSPNIRCFVRPRTHHSLSDSHISCHDTRTRSSLFYLLSYTHRFFVLLSLPITFSGCMFFVYLRSRVVWQLLLLRLRMRRLDGGALSNSQVLLIAVVKQSAAPPTHSKLSLSHSQSSSSTRYPLSIRSQAITAYP